MSVDRTIPVDTESHFRGESPPPDDLLGRYSVVGRLGEGGMGHVLLVKDEDIGRSVAAKVARQTDEAHGRFVLEAQITGQLEHPNIVPLYELGDAEGRTYFTMKQVHGRDLAEMLDSMADGKRVSHVSSLIDMLQIFLKVCDAVSFAHSRQVIHRDLKPANIMIGEFGEVLVMDWGLAKVIGDSGDPDRPSVETTSVSLKAAALISSDSQHSRLRTMDGDIMGTPAYMPPEQAEGRVEWLDPRSDIYSLGAILYHMLTLHPPFEGSALTVLSDVADGRFVTPTERSPERTIPWELESVVNRAMARQRGKRYQTVPELKADIEAFIGGRALAVVSYGVVQLLGKWARRHKAAVIGLGAAVIIALGALGISFWKISQALTREQEARLSESKLRKQAEQQQHEAQLQKDAARGQRDEVMRLADRLLLTRLAEEREGTTLWLVEPTEAERQRVVARITDWLKRARSLIERLPAHRASLDSLRQQGKPYRGGWRFGRHEDQWRHDVLAQLVAEIEALDEGAGYMLAIEGRLKTFRSLRQRSIDGHRQLWKETIQRISDVQASPRYGGLLIEPQVGLLPVGQDPWSGLWEFAVVGTGTIPTRDGRGKLANEEGTSIVLVLVPGGMLRMGARKPRDNEGGGPNIDNFAESDERPVHSVELAPYFLGKYEMTQGQWTRLAGSNPSKYHPGTSRRDVNPTFLHPVEYVTWTEGVYVLTRRGLRLPTEAQWEHAYRSGTSTIWYTGNDYKMIERREVDKDKLHRPVGSTGLANPFGFFDMGGNVREWCLDLFLPYDEAVEDERGLRRPSEDSRRNTRVYRGGAWHHSVMTSRSANRGSGGSGERKSGLGLRAARILTGERK